MDAYQKNTRLINHVTEFLDLDGCKSNLIAEFIALIDALREGLQQADEGFRMPDAQINILFLTKLQSRPEWKNWATEMLRDPRLSLSDQAGRMTFQELADRAMERERMILGEEMPHGYLDADNDATGSGSSQPEVSSRPGALSQDEINAFVVRKMSEDRRDGHHAKGHFKKPSQDEINEYVARQMRTEQERMTGAGPGERDQPRIRPRCGFCGDPSHQVDNCWRRWRVALEPP